VRLPASLPYCARTRDGGLTVHALWLPLHGKVLSEAGFARRAISGDVDVVMREAH
jgi:hypothetical protein